MIRYDSPYVYFSSAEDSVKDKIIREIANYKKFKTGWCFGEGEPFSDCVLQRAVSVYERGRKYGLRAEAMPGLDGDVTVTFQVDDEFLDVQVNEDGTYDIEYEKGIGENFSSEFLKSSADIQDIERSMEWLKRQEKGKSSGYLTCSTLVQGKDVSKRKYFKSPKMHRDYQYLTMSAESDSINTRLAST